LHSVANPDSERQKCIPQKGGEEGGGCFLELDTFSGWLAASPEAWKSFMEAIFPSIGLDATLEKLYFSGVM
jgi:hypothetical protein